MSSYTLKTTVTAEFAPTLERVRTALGEAGFGVITEIDMSATMKTKLDVDMPPQVILGACRPTLAHQAMLADPSIAAVLPCNVVVRSVDAGTTVVEAFDPAFMANLAGDALREVATDAGQRLEATLKSLSQEA
jgi:uncharacterized protein (DUF302 family)